MVIKLKHSVIEKLCSNFKNTKAGKSEMHLPQLQELSYATHMITVCLGQGSTTPTEANCTTLSTSVIGQILDWYKSSNSIKVSDKLDWFMPTEYLLWSLSCLAVIAWPAYNSCWKLIASVPLASRHKQWGGIVSLPLQVTGSRSSWKESRCYL